MSRIRIWWHRHVLGHYISESQGWAATTHRDFTCNLRWVLPNKEIR